MKYNYGCPVNREQNFVNIVGRTFCFVFEINISQKASILFDKNGAIKPFVKSYFRISVEVAFQTDIRSANFIHIFFNAIMNFHAIN